VAIDPGEREAAFLAALGPENDAFAVLSRDEPLQVRRLFLRSRGGTWWVWATGAGPVRGSPVEMHWRTSHHLRVPVLWGQVRDLLVLSCAPGLGALVRAMARAHEVCGEGPTPGGGP
jgi:hypothetical protein